MRCDVEVDATGLSCPLPVLRAKRALAELASGQVAKVVATDPASVADMQAFAKLTGNALTGMSEEGDLFVFYLRRK